MLNSGDALASKEAWRDADAIGEGRLCVGEGDTLCELVTVREAEEGRLCEADGCSEGDGTTVELSDAVVEPEKVGDTLAGALAVAL